MSAINYLTLVSTIVVTSSGTPVPPGYINIASTNSAPTWANSISTNGIQGSTIVVSSITTSTLTVSSFSGSTMTVSTLTGSNLAVSSLNASTLSGSTITVSTLTGSNITVSSLTGSTIRGSTISASTLTTATLTTTSNVGIGTTNPSSILDVRAVGTGDASNYGISHYFPPTYSASVYANQLVASLRFKWYADLWDIAGIRGGNTSWQSFAIRYNGTEFLTVGANGNVGIGTTDPTSKLHVVGSSSISTPSVVSFINNGAGQNLSGSDTVYSQITLGTYGPYIRCMQPNNGYTDLIRLDLCTNLASNNATPAPRISILSGTSANAGYVGIGTTSPIATLQVYNSSAAGAGYGSLLVDSPNAGGAGGCITIRNSSGGLNGFCSLIFEVDGSTSCTTSSTPTGFTQGNGMIYCQSTNANNAGKLGFILWNGSAEVELMSIQPNGNILLNGAGSNCSGINMPTAGYGLTWGPGYSRIYDDGNIHICTDDYMYFHTGSNTTTPGTEAMVISNLAHIGIGTATADAPLHIYKYVSRSYTSYGAPIGVQLVMTNSAGGRWYIGQDINYSGNSNLYFIANTSASGFGTLDVCGYIENDTPGIRLINFTGQHRCAYDDTIHYTISEGLIVRATGTYWSLADTYENTSQIDHITINESLPQITLVREANCPSVFGAVSFTEDTNNTRKNRAGRFTSVYANPFGEKKRVFVNALGEGGVWVCNINGNFTLGDLITTSTVPGYGMLQSSNQIVNYTFGKITMDCDFQPTLLPVLTARTKQISKTTMEPLLEEQITEEKVNEIIFDEETQRYVQKTTIKQTTQQVQVNDEFPLYDEDGNVIGKHTIQRQVAKTTVSTVDDLDANGNVQWDPSLDTNGVPLTKPAYQLRYLDPNGTILTKEQYDTRIQNGQLAYLAAFVGCIYQCG